MLCCGCKKPQHVGGARTKLLDPSVSNNYLYQQHQLNQANQAAALAAAAGQMQGTAILTPQMMPSAPPGSTIIATQAPTPGVLGHLPGNQRFVGGVVNYMVAGCQQNLQQQQQNLQPYGLHGQTVPGPGGRAQYAAMAASNTAIFTKQPGGGGMYSSMIFNQQQQQQQLQHQQQMNQAGGVDRPQSRVVHDLVALGPDSFRRVSGIAPDVFRQIEAVEAEFDPSTLAAQYAEMERRGEMIIRILNPASLNPAWLEDTCRRYSDGLRLPSWVQFVEVIKRPGQTLGLYIRDGNDPLYPEGVYINRIALESPVYQSGCLRVGDEILAINMVDVQRMSLDDVVIIMSIPRRLILTIRSRPLNATMDHLLPGANRIYGASGANQEGYYDTVASEIYSRVDDLGGRGRSSKPVVVLKQSLEDEEVAAAAEEAEAEAEAAAAAVAAALDAATVAAEVGLLDAAEIAAASAEQLQVSAIRARSSSLQRLDLLGGGRDDRPSSRMAIAQRHRSQQQQQRLFNSTSDNLAELADAYGYASRRGLVGRPGSAVGYSSMDRPSSRLSLAGRNAAMAMQHRKKPPGSQLYVGRLTGGGGSRARSATGRLLRTSSDLYLSQGPEELMDRALIQSAIAGSTARRHSITTPSSTGDAQMDYFLQRYNAVRANIRNQRNQGPNFHSLDRSSGGYKSAMRNSFSNQTLTGIGGGGSSSALAQRRLQSILASRGGRTSALGGAGNYDLVYSDTEAYETPSFNRRAMTPSAVMLDPRVGGSSYFSRSSSLPRGSAGPGGHHSSRMGSSRTDALNERLAQLEQFYAMTEAAKRQTLTGISGGVSGGRGSSRPQSALAGGQIGSERGEGDLESRREQMIRGSGLRNQSSSSGRTNLLPALPSAAAAARKSSSRGGGYHTSDSQKMSAYESAYDSSSTRSGGPPYHGLGYGGQDDQRTKEINAELNAVFMSKQMGESSSRATEHAERLRSTTSKDLIPASGQPQPPRPLMIDPSGFQQYGPELRTAHGRSESTGEQAGYSGLLVIHLLGVRGLAVDGGSAGAPSSILPSNSLERNLYCVVECDRVYKARTVAVQSQDSNPTNYDWDEVFDIDLFDTKEVTFLFYTWNASARHKLCSKGVVHLPWISTLRTQHVHAFEMRLYETPGAMLYIKLEFHDLRRTFTRLRRDPKAITSSKGSSNGKQGDHPLFGVDLETVIAREASGFGVPLLVKRCTEEIEARGLHLVGIYRLCGSAIRKRDLREKFEKNSWLAELDAQTVPDINVITSE